MGTLSRIAQSIFLGNREVWNFLDYAVNRTVTNLTTYTRKKDYLGTILFNNFNGGSVRRYDGKDINHEEYYYIPMNKRGDTNPNPATAPKGADSFIGDMYIVPSNGSESNSGRIYLNSNAFLGLQGYIRELNTNRNKNLYNSFLHDNAILQKNGTFIIDTVETNPNPISIKYISENVSAQTLSIASDGLYEYYSDKRSDLTSGSLKGIKYPQYLSGQTRAYTYKEPYGREKNNKEEPDKYFWGQEYEVNKEQVPEEWTGRESTVGYNTKTDAHTYTYYQENEKDTTVTLNNQQTAFNDTVKLSDYSSSSRLLRKTNELFSTMKTNTLINRFHTKAIDNAEKDPLLTAYHPVFGLSRGRNLLRKKYEDGATKGDDSTGYDNPYCRVWTAHHQYSKLKDRIRPFIDDDGNFKTIEKTQSRYGNLRTKKGIEQLSNTSVLMENGFVKISPTINANGTYDDNIKNYMFSIENLAWRDITGLENSTALSQEQKGPNGGRIMWFPPYNLKFTENVNVGWNENTFIGRGESVYTYTNTQRGGTLNFTLLIDHPSVVNKWRGTVGNIEGEEKVKLEKDLLRFFAGCGDLNDDLNEEMVNETIEESNPVEANVTPEPVYYSRDIAYIVFFPNDFTATDYSSDISDAIDILREYNNGGETDIRDDSYEDEILQDYNLVSEGIRPTDYEKRIKNTLLGSEDENIEVRFFNDLENLSAEFTGDKIFGMGSTTCKIDGIDLKGFASSHGYATNNITISQRRQNTMKELISYYGTLELDENNVEYSYLDNMTIKVEDIDGREDVNGIDAKIARAAYAIFHITWSENVSPTEFVDETADGGVRNLNLSNVTTGTGTTNTNRGEYSTTTPDNSREYSYDNEYLYFANLDTNSPLVQKSIIDKVHYFNPVYHTITPEGFNARLTFLHQCTRQGPTNAVNGGQVNSSSNDYLKYAGNLAFGRAPYCILRIGDFYNTKICITSLSIDYTGNGGGVSWDLNPEGIGVQPMYADVSINFNFFGGQDLSGPIERLQNAVTSNYYANTSVYSRHSDNESSYYDVWSDRNETRRSTDTENK